MNSSVYDDMLGKLSNGILKGQNSVEEIVETVKKCLNIEEKCNIKSAQRILRLLFIDFHLYQ